MSIKNAAATSSAKRNVLSVDNAGDEVSICLDVACTAKDGGPTTCVFNGLIK